MSNTMEGIQLHLSKMQKLKRRQLRIDFEKFTMVLDMNAKGLVYDRDPIIGSKLEEFKKKFELLPSNELKASLSVSTTEFQTVLSQMVPCVGCRRSVEKLYSEIDTKNYATLDPIKIKNGTLTVCDEHMKSSQLMCTLLFKHDVQLNQLLENQPRNKKSSRCNLHSLDSFRTKPFSETWMDIWDCMKQPCKEKVAVVEAHELHNTLDSYLKKHKFCQECRTKVEKAYTLLVNETTGTKEKGFVNAIYNGIKRCIKDKHIHLPTGNDYIEDLIRRAEPELVGRHRERHAKTMEIAQEEVLTCIGMCIYNRLKKVQQNVKDEENACQVLGAVAVYALCRSFDMAVENKRGINLELIYDEINRKERIKEQKKELKKLKKRKKRHEKKLLLEEELANGTESCNSCNPEPVSEKCACSTDDNNFEEYEDDSHVEDDEDDEDEDDEEDDDDDSNDKIVLCDGTIIDVGPGQLAKKPGGGREETDCFANRNGRNASPRSKQSHHKNSVKNCSNEHLLVDLVKDEVSVTSCQSCNNENDDGPCTQRSIDGGYESHHDSGSGSCCMSSNHNSSSSRTSSIASTPEGSEVACSDTCCNSAASNNKINKKEDRFESGLVLSLEQMLLDEPVDDDESEGVSYIPDEEILEFKSRNDIQQKREALREKLLKNFNDLCKKKCFVIPTK